MSSQLPHLIRGRLNIPEAPQADTDVVRLGDMQAALAGLGVPLATTPPADLGAAAHPGTSNEAARQDHAHKVPVVATSEDLEPLVSPLGQGNIHISNAGGVMKIYVGTTDGLAWPFYDQRLITDVITADGVAFFRTPTGGVYSCGRNNDGSLGRTSTLGERSTGARLVLPSVVQVVPSACGGVFFLTAGGEVYSCGSNLYGQLGRATPAGSEATSNLAAIPGLGRVVQIAANNALGSVFFLTAAGKVWSCGYNDNGQLGRAVATGSADAPNLGEIPGLPDVARIVCAANGKSTHFITKAGTVYNCGDNAGGQLGRVAASADAFTPNLGEVPDLTGVTAISSYGTNTLFLRADRAVWSCGNNTYGQLGRVVASGSDTTANLGAIPGLADVARVVSEDSYSTFFLLTDGTVWSCGYNAYGQLGRTVSNGSAGTSNLGQITTLSGVVDITCGADNSNFFLTDAGRVYSCGDNEFGQLGRSSGTGGTAKLNLGVIAALAGVKRVVCGATYTYFLLDDGTVYSCGENSTGQLGRAVATGSQTGANLGIVPGLSDAAHVVAGKGGSSYFLTRLGAAYSCGANGHGQLGHAAQSGTSSTVNLAEVAFS